ncbi:MAG: pyridoxal 5'-phosphate synthase glutaminase subunit PdxT [Actinobacteria bacterium]|nr:pyridoxal 5'-phosphate synthase glutaminase subunit PdxT [Actinomycetota bacterium]
MKVGILALQGDFKEHADTLKKCGAIPVEIRLPDQLKGVDGLIIPGGESTAIFKLIRKYGFERKLLEFNKSGRPIFGTCAGMILLASKIKNEGMGLGLIDIEVERNAYGRQIESFEHDIELCLDHKKEDRLFRSIFIRAPRIIRFGNSVKVMAEFDGQAVLAGNEKVMVCSFHPELTGDIRIHKKFIEMIKKLKMDKREN